jgi:ABC-type transport system involved in multi-copper enzyme maturation permease subunit
MHIGQFVVLRRYIPCIITSVLVLPYFIFTFLKIKKYFTIEEFVIWTIIAVVFFGINLLAAHKLSTFFDKKYNTPTNE